jgi:ABC-type glycerol-3-phosphate transport system permease component
MQKTLSPARTSGNSRDAARTANPALRNAALRKWLLTLLMLVLVLILDYPIFTIFLNAFRSTSEILSTTSIIPQHPTLENFV